MALNANAKPFVFNPAAASFTPPAPTPVSKPQQRPQHKQHAKKHHAKTPSGPDKDKDLKIFFGNKIHPRIKNVWPSDFETMIENCQQFLHWRPCTQSKQLNEIFSFGRAGLRDGIMALSGLSQNKPNQFHVFFFDANPKRQAQQMKQMEILKKQKGAAALYNHLINGLKGTTPIQDLRNARNAEIKNAAIKEARAKKEEEEKAKKAAPEAEVVRGKTFEELDRELEELALSGKKIETGKNNLDNDDLFDAFL